MTFSLTDISRPWTACSTTRMLRNTDFAISDLSMNNISMCYKLTVNDQVAQWGGMHRIYLLWLQNGPSWAVSYAVLPKIIRFSCIHDLIQRNKYIKRLYHLHVVISLYSLPACIYYLMFQFGNSVIVFLHVGFGQMCPYGMQSSTTTPV